MLCECVMCREDQICDCTDFCFKNDRLCKAKFYNGEYIFEWSGAFDDIDSNIVLICWYCMEDIVDKQNKNNEVSK